MAVLPKAESYKSLSDEEIVHRYRNSHEVSYIGELYERYTHLVFGVCMKYMRNEMAAEDATMQIFEKLITDLKKHHVHTFKPWLHIVVKNYCMMQFRKDTLEGKRKTELKFELGTVVENPEENHLEETEADKEFILEYLKDGIEVLKDEQKICIDLFYLKDKSYAEISDETGYSLKEVKSYIQNGKRNLKNFITQRSEQKEKGNSENL